MKKLSIILCLFLLCGCASNLSVDDRRARANALVQNGNLVAVTFPSTPYPLYGAIRIADPTKPARIYIEGDGYAWITRSLVSPDPTPRNPVALTLAAQDPSPNVVYVARPCQYMRPAGCQKSLWTQARLSEDVVQSTVGVLDYLRREKNVTAFDLVGYSGGGGLAVLVADRDPDVTEIRTVAGNLDTDLFTRHHNVSPMTGSLNPATPNHLGRGGTIPQIHFVGAKDTVIPQDIAESYLARRSRSPCIRIETIPGTDHEGDWTGQWPALLNQALPDRACASSGTLASTVTE